MGCSFALGVKLLFSKKEGQCDILLSKFRWCKLNLFPNIYTTGWAKKNVYTFVINNISFRWLVCKWNVLHVKAHSIRIILVHRTYVKSWYSWFYENSWLRGVLPQPTKRQIKSKFMKMCYLVLFTLLRLHPVMLIGTVFSCIVVKVLLFCTMDQNRDVQTWFFFKYMRWYSAIFWPICPILSHF